MKKTFMILGGVFAVLVVIAVIGIGIAAVKGTTLDKESKAYVDRVVPIICADLRADTLSKYASKELLASARPEDFEKLFKWFKKLGEFKKFKESTGQANMSYTTQAGKCVSGQYVVQVEFTTGPAQVQITTVKVGDEWKIQMFKINSSALLP